MVIAAAQDRFVAHGYEATTIDAVAHQAGVAAQTVYNLFHTKHDLLAAVLDAAIAGDAEPVPIVERSWFDRGGADTAHVAVARLATVGAAIVARVAPLYDVMRGAATHPEIAALLADNRRRRRADQAHLVGLLADAGHLRHGLDATTAADVVYALINEELFLMLTGDCGWDAERFATWLGELLVSQLC